jgi:hypothetical protein
MKSRIRTVVILALSIGLLALPTIAQRKSQKKDEGSRARGLFISKRADAMSILILKLEGGALSPVDPSRDFKQGDKIKVEFESNFDGVIYIVNVAPSGKRCIIFPYAGVTNNAVKADQRYQIPPGGDMIEFDEEKGVEVLQVIMSHDRIPSLDAALNESQGCLAQTASSAAEELQGGITNKEVTPVIPDQDREKVRSRDIILAPGKDKQSEGSVVAIPDKPGSSGRLKSGDVATFEVRLKHT